MLSTGRDRFVVPNVVFVDYPKHISKEVRP